jgi:putative ABC transport system permease protein
VNDFDLVRKNLFRRKLRASLMIVSILIAFMIFGVLAGFYRPSQLARIAPPRTG